MEHPTLEQLNALNRFALANGRMWRSRLHTMWLSDKAYPLITAADQALLRQIRNQFFDLPSQYQPIQTDWLKMAYLKKDRMERFTLKRGWFVNAWRIVNEEGQDLVQPWFVKEVDARDYAASQGIYLLTA